MTDPVLSSPEEARLLRTVRELGRPFNRVLCLGGASASFTEALSPLAGEVRIARTGEESEAGAPPFDLVISPGKARTREARLAVLRAASRLVDHGGCALLADDPSPGALLELHRLASQCGFKIVRMVPLNDRLRPSFPSPLERALRWDWVRRALASLGWEPKPVLVVLQKGWGYGHD